MPDHPSALVQNAGEIVADYMDAIKKVFKPGRRITVIVRSPDPAQDFIMSDDLIDEAVAALLRRKHDRNTVTANV